MRTTCINNIEDLDRIKNQYREKLQAYSHQILVCGGTGCVSSQCGLIKETLLKLVKDEQLEDQVAVIETGCMGLCAFGPVIVIMPEEVLYTELNPEKTAEIFQAHMIEGQVKEEYTFFHEPTGQHIPTLGEIPFIQNQVKVALKNCGKIDPSSIDAYIAQDGYYALAHAVKGLSGEGVLEKIKQSGLRGRGNGSVPVGAIWEAGRKAKSDPKYIVCDADDGDSKTVLNRRIAEGDPHAVIEGMLLAGFASAAAKGYVFVDPEDLTAKDRLAAAIEEAGQYGLLGDNILGSDYRFHLEICLGGNAYVCGEDTSIIAALEGKRGEPQVKPPYPSEQGLFNQPTIIHHAETFAHIPSIILGTAKDTVVFSLNGDVVNQSLVEVPAGMPLGELLYKIGGGIPKDKTLKALQVGGPSGDLIPKERLNTPVDFEALPILSAVTRSGGLTVMNEDSCMVDIALRYMEFIQDQSCGKCSPCRVGTKRLLEILERIAKGQGREGDIELLEDLSESIQLSSLCGFGETTPNIIVNTIQYFREEYEEHIRDKYCRGGVCADLVTSPCENACPAGINVPGYLSLISIGKYLDAYHLIRRENPFPAVCGRICTRPCESKCRRGQLDEAIAIADLKRFVSDCAFELENPLREEPAAAKKGKSIGIIGAGPSGLTCGYYLARLGYDVDVYETQAIAGGVLAYGIPEYRLPNEILTREIKLIEQAGVHIHLNTEIGKMVSFAELQRRHQAIYIATGSQIANKINVPGEELPGVVHGLDFLRRVNLGEEVEVGDIVAVIGGGNTAIDAARTALRKGAQKVVILYRRTLEDMPADLREIHETIEEGIEIMPLVAPVSFIGKGKIEEIECVRMELGQFDSGGRRRPIEKKGSNFLLKVDTVIPAVSQSPELNFMEKDQISVTDWGTLVTEKKTLMTTMEGVFAGGDITRGPDVAIHAIADGKQAAEAIDAYLGGKGILNKGESVVYPPASDEALHEHERYGLEILSANTRKNSFAEVGKGYHKLKAIAESMRCLRCDRR